MSISPITRSIRTQLARERTYFAAAKIAALAGIERSPESPQPDGGSDDEHVHEQEMLADVLEALALVLAELDGPFGTNRDVLSVR